MTCDRFQTKCVAAMIHSETNVSNTIRAMEIAQTMLKRVEEQSVHILWNGQDNPDDDLGRFASANQRGVSYLKYNGNRGKISFIPHVP